jgi:L-2-hydroxyglutarate oxidase LhgO
VDYGRVAEKSGELITRNGGTILPSHQVFTLGQRGSDTIIETTRGSVETRLVINCAGLHSDRISRMSKVESDLMIVPVRGEYHDIAAAKQHHLKGLIYRFPLRNSPSSKSISQNASEAVLRLVPTLCLPGSARAVQKHCFKGPTSSNSLRSAATGKWPRKDWKMSLGEYLCSWSKAAFFKSLQRLIPELTSDDLKPGGSGVRAQMLDSNGNFIDDFHFVYTVGIVRVSNVPSPAATASLAIARHIVDMVVQYENGNLNTLMESRR